MQQWEYLWAYTKSVKAGGVYHDEWTFSPFCDVELALDAHAIEMLTAVGRLGWELTYVRHIDAGPGRWVFKRPLQDSTG